jgi:peptidoglycan/LPS O-acetylase OafA/YrhL
MERLRARLAETFELPSKGRIPAMEGLRGIAVTLVFFHHYQALFGDWSGQGVLARFLGAVGTSGVDLFFVLSGYLIYGAVLRSRAFQYGTFMRRRVRRIYPTFAVVFAVYVALALLAPGEGKLTGSAAERFTYVVQNALLLPGVFHIPPLMSVAWSLSYEVFFYAVVPLLVATGMRGWSARARIATFVGVAAAFTGFSFAGAGRIQFVMFASGMLVYELLERERSAPSAALQRLAVALVVLVLPVTWAFTEASSGVLGFKGPALFGSEATSIGYVARAWWLFVAFAIIAIAAFRGFGVLARACAWTPLRWLGNMSYSYYLLHGLALKMFSVGAHRFFPAAARNPAGYWVAMPLFYAGTIVASAALFVAVEKRLSLAVAHPRVRPVPAAMPAAAA